MKLCVDFEWRDIGFVRVETGRLRFPDAGEAPGLYKFDLGDRVYIGETDRLKRRFQHYRTPGVRQPTNLRLNAVILELTAAGAPIGVAVVTDAIIEVDGHSATLNLAYKSARLLVENAALTAEQLSGRRVENL